MTIQVPAAGAARSARLFRTVERSEFADILERGRFRTVPGSIEGKLFWTPGEDAERFGRLMATRLGVEPTWVVEVAVDPAVLERLAPQFMDDRPARLVHQQDLDWFNEAMELLTRTVQDRGVSDE